MREQLLRVLLIEHDDASARAIAGMLEQARETVGEVATTSTLDQAIVRLAAEQFDVVILNFFLPDGTGPLNIALTGVTGVTVSGSEVSGAVNVVSTFTGKAPSGPNSNGPTWGLVRLNPGVSVQQAAGAVQSHHGDLNALTPYGSLFADDSAPGAVQTLLTPGNYVALNITGRLALGTAVRAQI